MQSQAHERFILTAVPKGNNTNPYNNYISVSSRTPKPCEL